MSKISVLGCGGWGTALSMLCADNDHEVVLWGKFADEVNTLKATRTTRLLEGVTVPSSIKITDNINDIKNSDVVIIATPSFAVRETAQLIAPIIDQNTITVSVAKGFEKDTLNRFSTVISQEISGSVVVLSGPSHAEEVARRIPTSIVAASDDMKAAETIQQLLSNERFRIYTNSDVIGVETGAALKNIIAVAAGICDGLGLGDNTIAALVTRGINEMSAFGVKMGALRETFSGLSGLGDLIVTCTSRHSRNRRFGKEIGAGMDVASALAKVGTVEGYFATDAAKRLSDGLCVEMPIINECYRVLYLGGACGDAINNLMNRSMKHE